MAVQIIDALSTKWDPRQYKDTYTNQVKQLIDAQAKGKHIVAEAPAQEAKVVDLMAALEASLKAASKGSASPPPRSKDLQELVQDTSDDAAHRPHKTKATRPAAKTRPSGESAKPRGENLGPKDCLKRENRAASLRSHLARRRRL